MCQALISIFLSPSLPLQAPSFKQRMSESSESKPLSLSWHNLHYAITPKVGESGDVRERGTR